MSTRTWKLLPTVLALTAACALAPGTAAAKPAVRLAEVTAPPPEHRADPALRTYVYRVGPVRIGAYETFRRSYAVKPPPVQGSIVGMDTRVVDRRGRPVPQNVLMLHHIVFTNGGPDGRRRDGACPERQVAERFYGTSEELRPLTLPRGYGYPSASRDRWGAIWMVMNHVASPRTGYVEYRVTVDPSTALTPVQPYWLSVVPCVSDPQYTVPGGQPAGSSHSRSVLLGMPRAGRIVAVGGHLHGGGRGLVLSQPRCRERELFTSRPTYGPPGDPLYRVRPMLHEPDPKNMSWFQSGTGWRIEAGEPLRVTAYYDGERPHMRVMGIAHAYVAPPGQRPADGCEEPPRDAEVLGAGFTGRSEPPKVRMELAALADDGLARPISRPPGRTRRLRRSGAVKVDDMAFRPANLSIPAGSSVRWAFRDRFKHDATLVSGPRGFATPTLRGGRRAANRFTVPGTYRLYCSIHPVEMQQTIRVRRR